jgi:hypothetical protein
LENFPPLQDEQVGLLRAEVATGHVLDGNHELVINDFQKVYTIFGDVNTVLLAAREIIKGKKYLMHYI